MIHRLDSADAGFAGQLDALLTPETERDEQIERDVASYLAAVRERGDAALLELTTRFDHWQPQSVTQLQVSSEELQAAAEQISDSQREALQAAAQRIRSYHEKQKQASWTYQEEDGSVLGQQITALDSVGVYVPGGKASYPSSVLMNAIPATVAGVQRVCMVVPTPRGELMPMVLAAAKLAGVSEIWKIGGAQAVAALAYGTETLARVDKIVGPGNIYVATAKRQVFGQVGLDMLAGPSEVLIIADGSVPADWLALDMFAQAEHDEMAQSILMCPDEAYLQQVQASIERLLPEMERRDIIATSLKNRGALIRVDDLAQAFQLSNRIAPEHLELALDQAQQYLPQIRHAGAIFLGAHSPEAFGDYCAGPNHVLPTSSSARFASPLGVYDFQKRSSIIDCSAQAAQTHSQTASELAYGEGLQAHALSALARRS